MSFLCLISHLLALIKTVSLCIPGGPNFLWVPSASFLPLWPQWGKSSILNTVYLAHSEKTTLDIFLKHSQSILQRSSPPPRAVRDERHVLRLCLCFQTVFEDSANASFPLGHDDFHGWTGCVWTGFGGCHAETGCRGGGAWSVGTPWPAEERAMLGVSSSLAFAR